MTLGFDDIDRDHLETALKQVIHGVRSTIASHVVERETALAALSELDGEDFEHYQHSIQMYNNEILFNQKKLAAAEAKLAELA